MISPALPGFADPVHDAQQTFRTLLDALAHPGQMGIVSSGLTPPPGLTPACAAACLTLLDLDTQVWLQPGLDGAVKAWLAFHAGCCFTPRPQQADFALIASLEDGPALSAFRWGTAEYPEASTTLLIQTSGLTGGEAVMVQGPGILGERAIAPQLPPTFWEQWAANHRAYPLGVDVFLFGQHDVLGLPRTAQVMRS